MHAQVRPTATRASQSGSSCAPFGPAILPRSIPRTPRIAPLALILGLTACSLINPFDDVKTSPTTGGAGGTTTTETTGGTGGTGTQPHEADCLDGADDDGDGDVDCADSDCQPDHECVLAPVTDWNGPLYISLRPYDPAAAEPDPCPDGQLPATYFAGPSPAECTPCDCTWTGAKCGTPELLFDKYNCDFFPGANWQKLADSSNTMCVNINSPDTGSCNYALGAGPAVLDPGTCVPSGGALTNPLPWGKRVDVCAAAHGGGCTGDRICVRKAPANYEEAVCMMHEGEESCPPGWLDRDVEIYGGAQDTRVCEGCGCSVDNVSCTGGSYTLNVGFDCLPPPGNGTTLDVVSNNSCVGGFNLGVKGAFKVSGTPHPGTPGGVECGTAVATGAVETAGKDKVCCRQMSP